MGEVDHIIGLRIHGYATNVVNLTLCILKSHKILLAVPRRLVELGDASQHMAPATRSLDRLGDTMCRLFFEHIDQRDDINS